MKNLKNDRGATLVLVLAIITIIMIFVSVLFYQLNSMTRQVNKSEANIQAENIAEMGVDYFSTHVGEVFEDYSEASDILANIVKDYPPILIELRTARGEQPSFEIEVKQPIEEIDEGYIIHYTSIGTSGDATVLLEREIIVNK